VLFCGGKEKQEEEEEEEEEEYEPGAASVLVALSELLSAEGRFADAAECLERAWTLKDEELGPAHPQVSASTPPHTP
jgi:hypothetical protein